MNKSLEVQPIMKREIEVQLLDKDKNVIPLFNENKLGKFLFKTFGWCPKTIPFGEYKSHKLITQ